MEDVHPDRYFSTNTPFGAGKDSVNSILVIGSSFRLMLTFALTVDCLRGMVPRNYIIYDNVSLDKCLRDFASKSIDNCVSIWLDSGTKKGVNE